MSYCYIIVPLIHYLISHTWQSNFQSFTAQLQEEIWTTTPKTLQTAQNSDRENQDQGAGFFRKQFYQKHGSRSNLKCSRHVTCTTASQLPFTVLCIIGHSPDDGMFSWHPGQSKLPIFDTPLSSGCTQK